MLGYAPFYFYPATLLALAGLFTCWYQAKNLKEYAMLGLAFGLGLFGTGISWIYISLHTFGGMPVAMAGFATFLICLFLSLFPMAVGILVMRFPKALQLCALPLLWTLIEWSRGWIFTGFPWLVVGYSQIPYSPLAGVAPIFGIYGVTLSVAATAALIAGGLSDQIKRKPLLLSLIAIWIISTSLTHIEWSQPYGKPLRFSLLQGNISQDMKWREDELVHTLTTYRQMIMESQAQLIVLPEMAFPVLLDNLPQDFLNPLIQHARSVQGNLLIGVPEVQRGQGDSRYFNSQISYGTDPSQHYSKSHLVPFGEFIPMKPILGWIYKDFLHIPLSDLTPGSAWQKPMQLSGQLIAMNICYEDVFGEEVIRQLPEATLLVNVSNDAWYGRSLAADQHMQMSQARALETARPVLRATNTGATALIDTEGHVIQRLPLFVRATLEGEIQGVTGTTPFTRWGNWGVICLTLMMLIWLIRKTRSHA